MAIKCPVTGCAHTGHYLVPHIVEEHGLDPADFNEADLVSDELEAEVKVTRRAPDLDDLKFKFGRYTYKIDPMVPEEECLPGIPHYFLPQKGKAARAHERANRALKGGEPVFLYGGPGTGKDALPHQFCYAQRKPSLAFCFTRGTDVKGWFYKQKLDSEGTGWEFGALWKALTEGYVGADGIRRPFLILFSDVDRGDEDQLEEFRLVLDTTSKRVIDPYGKAHKILAGTQFVFTANSNGNGADGMSSRPIDGSLLDRMGEFVRFHHMAWEEEVVIYRAMFPGMNERMPEIFDTLGKCVERIRAMLVERKLYCSSGLSMRGVQAIMKCARNVAEDFPKRGADKILAEAMEAWTGRLDEDQTLIAEAAINEAVKGGVLNDPDQEVGF